IVKDDVLKSENNCLKIEYTFYTGDWNENWISISRNFSSLKDFSSACGISLWVKGSGSEGKFVVAIKDNKGNTLEYANSTVLTNSVWSQIIIPFNMFYLKNKITLKGFEEFDFSKISYIEFYISLPDRTQRELPISGVCYVDQVELVKNIFTFKKPIFSKIPNGYLYSEYYQDTEVGEGIYQSLILNDELFFNENISLYWNLKLPSKYVIYGYIPARKIDWMRGDDIKLLNQKEYSISFSEISLKFKKLHKYLTSLTVGSAFIHWNPWVFYGQSKNLGITLSGSIASAGDYESFIGGDYWKRVLVVSNRFMKKTRTSYLIPMFVVGRQYAKDVSSDKILPLVDFYVLGLELRKKIELPSLKLYDTNLYVTLTEMGETVYGLWKKENSWDDSLSYSENLPRVMKGGVLLEKLFDIPSSIRDNAIVANLQINKVANTLFSFVLEGRYIGSHYGGFLLKDTLLPWLKEDLPPNLMNIETKLDSSILERRYHLVPSGYLDTGYVDQKGGNFKIYYNRGKGFDGKLELDMATKITNPNIRSQKIETTLGYNKTNQIIGLEGVFGVYSSYEKDVEKNKITYYEADVKLRPFRKFDFSVACGYRVEEREIYQNLTKQIYFIQFLSQPLPFISVDFRIKQSSPQEDELGGTISIVREGDYKVWADHMPDTYTYLQIKIFF
ncbi:MAG: CIA30 family protein, partial [Brevinematales bacterium]|nr:CIA30 family protein [Brevinematales bacterium]